MDHHHRRLSVSKSSASKITKPSSSRRPATIVSTNLSDFPHVVQQLTGTPPSSASPSPLHESTRSSRLQRIAPPPLRRRLHHQHQQNQRPLQHSEQQYLNLPVLHQDGDQRPQHAFSWLPSEGLLSPPLLDTQVANFNDSNFTACISPSPNPKPHQLQLSALPAPTPIDSFWDNPLHAIPSPGLLSNSGDLWPPLLPLPSVGGGAPPLPSGSPLLPSPLNRRPLLPFTSNGHAPPSHAHPQRSSLLPSPSNGRPLLGSPCNENPVLSSSSSNEKSLLCRDPLLPSPRAAINHLPPHSPSSFFNPWLQPWPSSPFLPPPVSPGLWPPSPGLGSLISSPRGIPWGGTNDYQWKLP